jgi:hypothetical protein
MFKLLLISPWFWVAVAAFLAVGAFAAYRYQVMAAENDRLVGENTRLTNAIKEQEAAFATLKAEKDSTEKLLGEARERTTELFDKAEKKRAQTRRIAKDSPTAREWLAVPVPADLVPGLYDSTTDNEQGGTSTPTSGGVTANPGTKASSKSAKR